MNFIAGLDLGQAADYSALVVAEKILPPPVPMSDAQRLGLVRRPVEPPAAALAYHLRHVQRYPLGTPYPAIVTEVKALMQKLVSLGATSLVVDKTGVGAPVVDMLVAVKLPCLVYA